MGCKEWRESSVLRRRRVRTLVVSDYITPEKSDEEQRSTKNAIKREILLGRRKGLKCAR